VAVPLTPAERRILELTKRGHEDAAIARTFGMSVITMRELRAAAERKLGTALTQGDEYWNR
jgi:DNA-binding CsgD family transcriptional regulator